MLPFFLYSKQVQVCGRIFILCSFFSCAYFGCLLPNGKGVAFGEESTDIYTGRTFVNVLISWQGFM